MIKVDPWLGGRLIHFQYPALITIDDLTRLADCQQTLLENVPQRSVHVIHNMGDLCSVEPEFSRLASPLLALFTHPALDWIVMVGQKPNPISQFLSVKAVTVARIRYRSLSSLEQALLFFRQRKVCSSDELDRLLLSLESLPI